ncbi:MAG: hypothetical protein ACM3VY_00720 [Candidatus Bathyarchaeota archaeon]
MYCGQVRHPLLVDALSDLVPAALDYAGDGEAEANRRNCEVAAAYHLPARRSAATKPEPHCLWGVSLVFPGKAANVPKRSLRDVRLVALFILGGAVLTYPLLSLVSRNETILGIPILYAYIYGIWVVLIALAGLVTRP